MKKVSVRLNKDDEILLEQLQQKTGLSASAILRKNLYGNSMNTVPNILSDFGKILTSVNLAELALNNSDLKSLQLHLNEIKNGVTDIWQFL